MKALILEHDRQDRLVLKTQLHLLGYEIAACAKLGEAVMMLQTQEVSLVVLDVEGPGIHGIEWCRRLRAACSQDEPLLLLVIAPERELKQLLLLLDEGADDYLCKPLSPDQLKLRLTVLGRQRRQLLRCKQAEHGQQLSAQQIQRAKYEWEATADSLSHIVCLVDSRGRIARANRVIESWGLGTVAGVRGLPLHTCLHPTCKDTQCYLHGWLRHAWEKILRGQAVDYEGYDPCLNRHVHLQLRPISVPSSRKTSLRQSFAVLVLDDISERIETQEMLIRQDRLLLGVAGAMNYLLMTPDFQTAVMQALNALGLAADVDRIHICETHFDPETKDPLMSQRFEWDRFSRDMSPATEPEELEFQNIPYRLGLRRWYETLRNNQPLCSLVRELPLPEQEMLTSQNIMSILLVPIMVNEVFWGFIGLNDCHSERIWRDEEQAVLIALAGSIGGAIARQQIEEQLRQTSAELRAVFQSLPDEYFRLSRSGNILDYKVEHDADLYLYPETFIGKWASGLLPPHVEQEFDAAIARVRRTRKIVSIEHKLPTRDQQQRCEEIRLIPFLNEQLIVVARDITDRKMAEEELQKHRAHLEELVQERTAELLEVNQQLQQEIVKRQRTEEQLRELNLQLEQASQHKSQFLASMSHELRTPLNAMIGYTSLTLTSLSRQLSADLLQNLTKAEQSARVLLQLINDVLDFSKIEAGQMEVFLEKIELTDILEDVTIIAEGLLLKKPVRLITEIAPALPPLTSDYTKVKQILNNLLSNAIKFTQEGFVAVRAFPSDDGKMIRIEIEDSGEGIPGEKIDHIFESFKQVDESVTRRFGGTGLGLSITRKFCEMLGIEIGVESQVGKGSLFWLILPVLAPASQAMSQEVATQAASSGQDASLPTYGSILLIDDDEMNLDLLEKVFISEGHVVHKALTGQEGLQLAREKQPDVILMDLVMPDLDGFEVTRLLKEDARTRKIPVIACSAVATEAFHRKAKQVGCEGYITKPIEPARLLEKVSHNIHKPGTP